MYECFWERRFLQTLFQGRCGHNLQLVNLPKALGEVSQHIQRALYLQISLVEKRRDLRPII
jgi:hypothetical protein